MPTYEVMGTGRFTNEPQRMTIEAGDEEHARELAGLEGLIVEEVREVEPPAGDSFWGDAAETLGYAGRSLSNRVGGFRPAKEKHWFLLIGSYGLIACAAIIAVHAVYLLLQAMAPPTQQVSFMGTVQVRRLPSSFLTSAIAEFTIAFAATTLAGIGLAMRKKWRAEK